MDADPPPYGVKLARRNTDFEGLELRCLAHYMASFDKGAYANIVINGDVHWTHTLAMGLAEGLKDPESLLHKILRDNSKTFTYADLYGCGTKKAGLIVYGIVIALRTAGLDEDAARIYKRFFGGASKMNEQTLRRAGEALKRQFMKYFPARARLDKRVKDAAREAGKLKGLDGRFIPVRKAHAALNTLLQSCGAVLCKTWMVDAYNALLAAGYRWGWDGDFVIVGFIHDELQIAVREKYVTTKLKDDKEVLTSPIAEIVVQCARDTGPKYGFKVRLDSGFVIGNNWRDTH